MSRLQCTVAIFGVATLMGCGGQGASSSPGLPLGGAPSTTGGNAGAGAPAAGGGAGAPATGGSSSGATSGGNGAAGAPTTAGAGGLAQGGAGGGVGVAGSASAGDAGMPPPAPELIGWATQGTGTTGGGSVARVVATTIEQLNMEAAGDAPKVIHVQGKLTGTLTVGSNKTIVGLSGAEITNVGPVVRLADSKNVIIRNLKLTGAHAEINTVFHNSTNVWFDHNAVTNGKSDLMRVTGTSNYVTISWNIFDQTAHASEHMGVNIGLTDLDEASKGLLNVTLHHNLYMDQINERMPRVRFGKVHTFNNVCNAGQGGEKAYYAVRAGVDANVRSERNVYKDFIGPSWWWTKDKFGAENATVFNYARGNANSILQSIEDVCLPSCVQGPIMVAEHQGVTGEAGFFSKGTAFVPPYQYAADPTDGLEAKVMTGAGPK